MLISVIVPVYNVEDYLEDCVNSILKQSLTDFELILVDDGSTDRSGDICEFYEKKDSRIRVFHKPNGGLSDARNYGVKRAKGEFLTFIDSDDFVDSDYLQILFDLICDYNADVSCIQAFVTTDRTVRYNEKVIETGCFSGKEAIVKSFCWQKIAVSACGKLYRSDLFGEVEFPKGALYEDILTIPYIFMRCTKVAYSNRKLYYYYNRPGSITHSTITDKHTEILSNMKELINNLDRDIPEVHDAAVARFCTDSIKKLVEILLLSSGYFKRIKDIKMQSNQYWKEGLRNKVLAKSIKIQIRILLFSPLLYWLLFTPYKRIIRRMERIW